MTIFGDRTYAWSGDDMVLAAIFEQLGMETPSYLDVGAGHPISMSNTALFYRRGSKGVNVEAMSEKLELFHKARPLDTNLHLAVGPERGTHDFFVQSKGLNSLKIWEELTVQEIRDVKVVTLNDVVNEHCKGVFPDLLSIDIEGSDFDVLESTDFNGSKPMVIIVEAHRGKPASNYIRATLEQSGFYFLMRCTENCIFIRNDLREKLF